MGSEFFTNKNSRRKGCCALGPMMKSMRDRYLAPRDSSVQTEHSEAAWCSRRNHLQGEGGTDADMSTTKSNISNKKRTLRRSYHLGRNQHWRKVVIRAKTSAHVGSKCLAVRIRMIMDAS